MVWFYARGAERRSCETRLAIEGDGYELVVRDASDTRIERFSDLRKLLGREHELLTAWRAQGWRNAQEGNRTADRLISPPKRPDPNRAAS